MKSLSPFLFKICFQGKKKSYVGVTFVLLVLENLELPIINPRIFYFLFACDTLSLKQAFNMTVK